MSDEPLLLDLPGAQRRSGLSRSTLYKLHTEGRLAFVKVGRRTLVSDRELRRFVEELEQGPTMLLAETQRSLDRVARAYEGSVGDCRMCPRMLDVLRGEAHPSEGCDECGIPVEVQRESSEGR